MHIWSHAGKFLHEAQPVRGLPSILQMLKNVVEHMKPDDEGLSRGVSTMMDG